MPKVNLQAYPQALRVNPFLSFCTASRASSLWADHAAGISKLMSHAGEMTPLGSLVKLMFRTLLICLCVWGE